MAQVSGVIALLLTLAAVAWFLGRWVVRPLATMSRDVARIAGGDLDIHPPSSRAREVREIAAALTALCAALGQALARQAALEEERRLFISAIAHDLRTPLFMLRGYLKGLETGVAATPEKVAQYVRACGMRADALERLIADLFAYTRLEYLDQGPRRESLELGALLGEAVAEIQPMAATKGIIVALDGPSGACPFTGDRTLLGRAVQNLLDNAVRHTPDGGSVRVRGDQEGGRYVFRVQDTGPGITPRDLPHLFTPLYRAEPSRNRRTGGAGLGLTIALRILRAHGGNLTAANADTGGALFTGTLPMERATPLATEPETTASSPEQHA
jgi:signal transduction histidine kinase